MVLIHLTMRIQSWSTQIARRYCRNWITIDFILRCSARQIFIPTCSCSCHLCFLGRAQDMATGSMGNICILAIPSCEENINTSVLDTVLIRKIYTYCFACLPQYLRLQSHQHTSSEPNNSLIYYSRPLTTKIKMHRLGSSGGE